MTIREWNEVEAATAEPTPAPRPERTALTPQGLVELYADDVWRYASSKLRHREDAEDVAMEVFASAMRDFHRIEKVESVRLWLLGIARNKVNDALRKTYRRAEGPLSDAFAIPTEPESIRGTLQEALAEMPDLHREVLVLKYVNGLSTEEVAKVIRKSAAAANSLLQRARQSLREHAQPLIDAQGGTR